MKVTDLLHWPDVEQAIAEGMVGRQLHPKEPLAILNYTHACMYAHAWDEVTMTCRGLIYNTDTMEIVARPWKKFFNYGQPGAPELDLRAPCITTDKEDGSLGIMYRLPSTGEYAIATRGSFTSEQAVHATKVWLDTHARYFSPDPGTTYLFEIVYPANRIVMDYQGMDDIIFLGAVEIETGHDIEAGDSQGFEWPGVRADVFPWATLAEALGANPRTGAEGMVLYFPETGDRLKIKQDDYIALHRIMTNVTPRVLWEYLAVNDCKKLVSTENPKQWESTNNGLSLHSVRALEILAVGPQWLERMIEKVPDEFYDWITDTVEKILLDMETLEADIYTIFEELRDEYEERKDFAIAAKRSAYFNELMSLYLGRSIKMNVWRRVYPPAAKAWMNVNEDVA